MRRIVAVFLGALFGVFLASAALATYSADISYDYVFNGGINYRFDFTVRNTSTGMSLGKLDYFEISFDADSDPSTYFNLAWVNDRGWFAQAFEYDPAFGSLPAGVSADDSVLFGSGGGGIAQGNSVAGFRVSFDYSGSLAPDQQLFSWFAEFGTNDQGNGTPVGDPGNPDYWIQGEATGGVRYEPVQDAPEPGTMLLLVTGLGALIGRRLYRG